MLIQEEVICNCTYDCRIIEIICLLLYIAGIAVLGIALISMGEEVGAEMSYRTFGHLVGFQDLNILYENLDLLLILKTF